MPKIMHSKLISSLIVGFFLCAVLVLAWPSNKSNLRSISAPKSSQSQPKTVSFNKKQYSLIDPSSIWVVVNKHRPLNPQQYAPSDLVVPKVPLRVPGNETMQLRKEAASALETMLADSKSQGVPMMLSSGYRSYSYQVSLYGSYVKTNGVTTTDNFSAHPGYSEHQTGLAVDIEPLNQQCDVEQCFADLPAGKWIAANAYKYGFILRYTADKVQITGYMYEPWHIRYVGIALSTQMHKQDIKTLEEFFNLPAAPNYM